MLAFEIFETMIDFGSKEMKVMKRSGSMFCKSAVLLACGVATAVVFAGVVSINDLAPYDNTAADGEGGFWNTTGRAALTVSENATAATEGTSSKAVTAAFSGSGAVEPRAMTSEPSAYRMIKTGKSSLCITFR